MNLLELRNNVVHADCSDGNDYTLCGVSASNVIGNKEEYDEVNETETEPYMISTDKKITCDKCATIIRYCCRLGTRSIKKGLR